MDLGAVQAFAAGLTDIGDGLDDSGRIDMVRALETVKAACAGAQARVTADFYVSQHESQGEMGVPTVRRGRGVAAQVALARRESPSRGGRYLGMARALVLEMPHTLSLLSAGVLSEWRATILVRETACLSREDRMTADFLLCGDPSALEGLGDRAVTARVRACAAELDAEAVVRRASQAVADRRVTIRPAPDTMANLSALLPVAQGVAVYAALARGADSIMGAGESRDRTRSQIMADLLVERVTGLSSVMSVPVAVNLVISDQSLFGQGHDPAEVQGYGPIPAALARQWVADAAQSPSSTCGCSTACGCLTQESRLASLRKVYAHPETGTLTALESRARAFPSGLVRFIEIRDRTCRTPWCDAPIRHHDHIQPYHSGGSTTAENGAGLCAGCNYAKQAPGWTVTVSQKCTVSQKFTVPQKCRSRAHTMDYRTPTGHGYRSVAPPLPRPLILDEPRYSHFAHPGLVRLD